ncbi:hypothetical protein [Pedobacter punctiformis]|uniref:Uncharacterized protein n=1 Tax=Pedobacter punctiformis TaxID=3004097 RepID=A0ABT4L3X2_9SPHI|nr:hypothetical protein [Pedobacter sp. HCMS5-2]MCZ4242402.1 hypothetical protein [Pedobacter sp. HCMS5-2]
MEEYYQHLKKLQQIIQEKIDSKLEYAEDKLNFNIAANNFTAEINKLLNEVADQSNIIEQSVNIEGQLSAYYRQNIKKQRFEMDNKSPFDDNKKIQLCRPTLNSSTTLSLKTIKYTTAGNWLKTGSIKNIYKIFGKPQYQEPDFVYTDKPLSLNVRLIAKIKKEKHFFYMTERVSIF